MLCKCYSAFKALQPQKMCKGWLLVFMFSNCQLSTLWSFHHCYVSHCTQRMLSRRDYVKSKMYKENIIFSHQPNWTVHIKSWVHFVVLCKPLRLKYLILLCVIPKYIIQTFVNQEILLIAEGALTSQAVGVALCNVPLNSPLGATHHAMASTLTKKQVLSNHCRTTLFLRSNS